MSITFTCECGKSVQVGDEYAGQTGQCPSCRRMVRIPSSDGQFAAGSPRAVPPPPWEEVRRAEPLPEPEEDIGRVVTHAGMPISENEEFFVEAPPEIGRLYSAHTTLKRDQAPMALSVRILVAAAGFVLTGIVPLVAAHGIFGQRFVEQDFPFIAIAACLIGAIFAGVIIWWTRFSHTCSYVGTKGIALFRCTGDRDRIVHSEFFLFGDAAELRISQTRHYYNGVYTGTQYSFSWTNDRGEVVQQLSGNYKSEQGNPHPADAYHFAIMAENAWTMHLFRDIDRMTSGNEMLFFGLKGGDYVEVGRAAFALVQGGKTIRLRADQIEKMTVGNGVISVWEVGAKEGWFVNKGIHQFMYHDLGNARFFLFALERLLGIRF